LAYFQRRENPSDSPRPGQGPTEEALPSSDNDDVEYELQIYLTPDIFQSVIETFFSFIRWTGGVIFLKIIFCIRAIKIKNLPG
jgi:hypothetical protein